MSLSPTVRRLSVQQAPRLPTLHIPSPCPSRRRHRYFILVGDALLYFKEETLKFRLPDECASPVGILSPLSILCELSLL